MEPLNRMTERERARLFVETMGSAYDYVAAYSRMLFQTIWSLVARVMLLYWLCRGLYDILGSVLVYFGG